MGRKLTTGKCHLQKLLDKRNLEHKDLSEITGIDTSSISLYASNSRAMSLDNAATIAQALGIRIDDLYDWIPKENRAQRR
ncbi:helix-turn-helix transcriptional regulator [Alkalihalophilus pseudofirmus]|uniref:helix-turn-helix domain-containing protein n=1 Tax=Alkalihalophilus pseudofirmus TaxID=79885 RepID=UPI00259AFBFB|nr:helix-turn-helix transcriptional regulator [Alkalihalophilus pseudofirmus]WEG18575.1 helix-turn-helix transcriptional regulator [Alkalihalophilus pseudofirmus]